MRDAMVSVEDRRFRSHLGVDPIGIARGVQVQLRSATSCVAGVSTITQQLARNVFLTSEPTYGRKFREGDPGAGARAQVHQGPDPRTLPQQGLFRRRRLRHRRRQPQVLRPSAPIDAEPVREPRSIAGLVKAPSNYSPTADAEAAVDRARRRAAADAASRASPAPPRSTTRRHPRRSSWRPSRSRIRCAISPTGRCRSSTC